MAKKNKPLRPKARLPKGLRDVESNEINALNNLLANIGETYALYGFEPLETPAFEYSDVLGKFLPDQERPNAGVFSFEDEDDQWLSLRYDLTAPLARFVAQNYDRLPKPFRRFQSGQVWRNEKPGPGRYRQFMQFDADTVGTTSVAADAELCMLAAESLERCGISTGAYTIRVNNRKLLDGILETIGVVAGSESYDNQRLTILRAVDKLDRLGEEGVRHLLGDGRKDESGDYTKGAGLGPQQIDAVMAYVTSARSNDNLLSTLGSLVKDSEIGEQGVRELEQIETLVRSAGFSDKQIAIDPSVVRGLDYYTGPVFEAELMMETTNEKGQPVSFGSVGGGGRYDGLVARFKGVEVPATGFSFGVSRLLAAVSQLDQQQSLPAGPVIVLVMDQEYLPDYQRLTRRLRQAGIATEMYLGTSGMRAQMKYADKRQAPCVVIQGEDERQKNEVTIKDLVEGARLSEVIEDNVTWREGRPAQFSVSENELVEAVERVLENTNS